MNLDSLNKWLTLLANLGVVAGIIFLAIEIRQNQISLDRNSELVEREYELQVADGQLGIAATVNEFRFLTAGDHELAEIWLKGREGNDLPPVDQYRFMALCGALIWSGAAAYRRNVVLGRHEFADAHVTTRRRQLSTEPGTKNCWDANVAGLRVWGYGDLVDAVSNVTPD